jgi:hypothetical protein
MILSFALFFSVLHPKRPKFDNNLLSVGLIATSVMLLVYSRFGQLFGTANVFRDPRVEVNDGIITTANNLFINNVLNLPRFFMGFFGRWGLGWFEIELSPTIWIFGLEATILVVVFSLMKSSKFEKLTIILLFALSCVAVLYLNQKEFAVVGNNIQPRYFLPLFLGIVIIATYRKSQSFPGWLLRTVAILSVIANSIALRDTIRRYTTGQDVLTSKSLNQPIEWWWKFGPQPETIWLVGTLTFIFLFILIDSESKNRYSSKTHD